MTISYDTFSQVEIRVGTVKTAEPVEGSEKLLRLTVDLGEENPRQIVSGIAKFVSPEDLVGKQLLFVTNLEPRIIFGFESNGMLFAAGNEDTFTLLGPEHKVPPGTKTS